MVNGIWTESFQPGEFAISGLASNRAREVFALSPELRDPALNIAFRDARTALRGFEAQIAKSVLAAA